MDEIPAQSTDTNHVLLLAQIREIYGRLAYTHKTHEKQADICEYLDRRQRRVRVVLTAVSSGVFATSLVGLLIDEQWAALATSFIAVLVSISALGNKAFKYGEEMQQNRETAAKLWSIRESYLSLIVDFEASAITGDAARRRRDHLQEMAKKVLTDAPRTSAKAYKRAQDGLKFKEDLTFTALEIDALLPERLRTGVASGNVADQ